MSALPAEQTSPAQNTNQACAYVLHGLNTNPARMEELGDVLRKMNIQTSVGTLSGHSQIPEKNEEISAPRWAKEFAEQWINATATCKKKNDKRIFVGYSLGALTAMSVFDSQKSPILPTQMILLSPALNFRYKVMMIRSIAWLPFGSLPSLNHPDYRARPTTPLRSYNALFELHSEWKNNSWRATASIPTLVVLSEKDELVDSQAVAKTITEKRLDRWNILWISNDDAPLSPRYYHLMIDQRSMGARAWHTLKETLEKSIPQSDQESPKNAR
ncbi:MAG: hypothetical protein RI932_1343 [Pseudomonadota bacterium]|jgi:esterase/lipase